jgi:uncharacterized protein (TIGR03790 family)
MAERIIAYRERLARLVHNGAAAVALAAVSTLSVAGTTTASGDQPAMQRLHAADIGLVINLADPYSVAVGRHYIRARRLREGQVLRLRLPVRSALSEEEFNALKAAIDAHFGPRTQALALAWSAPYAVACNSITGALALGFDAALCRQTCASSRLSPYFSASTARPWSDYRLRPSMLLAAPDVRQARALIDRGVAADGSLVRSRRASVNVLMLATDDPARRVRMTLYPNEPLPTSFGVAVRFEPETALPGAQRLLMAITGSARVPLQPAPRWLPGGLGDHLTSWGGDLQGTHGQTTALDWIASGATASHGAVTEPCNHLQKFPHPQLLLLNYVRGSTAIEAYWKSVAWPQQSLFVGEPLAAPFARR